MNTTQALEYVGPERAKQLLSSNKFEFQRRMDPKKVQSLVKAMQDEVFYPSTISICVFNGMNYLVNGQHRMNAIIEAKIPQRLTISYLPVESMKAVAEWYQRFDCTKPRVIKDKIRAINLNECGVTLAQQEDIIHAMNKHKVYFEGTKTICSTEEYEKLIVENSPAYLRYCEAIEGAKDNRGRRLKVAAYVCVGMIIMTDRPIEGREFFKIVASGGAVLENPAARFAVFVDNHVSSGGSSRGTQGKTVNDELKARALCAYWNQWFKGKSRTSNISDALLPKQPLSVTGTRWEKTIE